MTIDIVIVSFNTAPLLRKCLESVRDTTSHRSDVSVYVVDNASEDGSADVVNAVLPRATAVRLDANLGFGPANNRGAQSGHGDAILFLNSDAELTYGAIEALEACLREDESAIAAGPRLVYPDGSFQPSCRRFPTPLRNFWQVAGLHLRFPRTCHRLHTWLTEEEHQTAQEVDMVSGACFLVRRTYFESVGGFDSRLFLYEEELDLFFPTRYRGLSVLYCPAATVVHHHGASSGEKAGSALVEYHQFFSKYLVFAKHYGRFAALCTFWCDRWVFGLSALSRKLRGRTGEAASRFLTSKRAFRDTLEALARQPG